MAKKKAEKRAERELKELKKKHGKLKKYVKHLEKQLQDLAKPAGPAVSVAAKGKAKGMKKAAKPAAASAEKDNLKQIRGIGAVLEKKLNDAGITRFEQIAAWTEEEIAALPADLNLGTRPQRDDWMGQAKKLM